MRVLFIPHFGARDLRSESVANVVRDYVHSLSEYAKKEGSGVFFYLLLPRGMENYEVMEAENVKVVLEDRLLQQFFTEIDSIDLKALELFSARTGIYPIDVVITTKTAIAMLLSKHLSDYRFASDKMEYPRIPVIIIEDRAFGRKNTHNLVDSIEFALRAVSYAFHHTIFMDEFEYEEALDASKQYLTPAMFKSMTKKAIMYVGVRCKEIDEVVKDVKKRDRFTLFWGGRLSAQKRPGFVLQVYNKFYELGYDVDIVVTSPHYAEVKTDQVEKEARKNSRIIFKYGASREEYLRTAASSHVFLSGSLYEGFSLGHAEVAYLGVPMIVPRRPWSEMMFGRDYKLMYNPGSEEEALAMLIWCYENYDECSAIGQETRKRIRELFDSEKTHMVLWNLMKDVYNEYVAKYADKLVFSRDIAESLRIVVDKLRVAGYDEVPLSIIIRELEKTMRVKRRWHDPRLGVPSMWGIYQYLKNVLKCDDTYKLDRPVIKIGSCSGV